MEAGAGDWRAAAAFLAERSRENWGDPERVDGALISSGLSIHINLGVFNKVEEEQAAQDAAVLAKAKIVGPVQ